MKKFLLLPLVALLALTAAVTTPGCATLTGANTASVAVQAGIEFAVATYIQHKGNNTPATEAAVAAQITTIATELEAVVQGNVTVAQFNAQLAPYIAKLKPAEQILAQELLVIVDGYFAQLIANKGSILNSATTAAATVVLNDVVAAAALFTSTSSVKAFKA
jgi:hypothetical protein